MKRCDVHFSPTISESSKTSLYKKIQRKLSANIHSDTSINYMVRRVSKDDHPGLPLLLPAADVIVLACSVARVDQEFLQKTTHEIHALHSANPGTVIALYMNIYGPRNDPALLNRFAFNAKAVGASVLFADNVEKEQEYYDHAITGYRPLALERQFKAMVDAAVLRHVDIPLTSIDFASLPRQAEVTLGDFSITRIPGKRAPAAVMRDLETGEKAPFTAGHAALLWTLAAFKGTPLTPAELFKSYYDLTVTDSGEIARIPQMAYPDAKIIDVHLTKLSKHFQELGCGKVHGMWGAGRLVLDQDWQPERDYVKDPAMEFRIA